MRPDDQTKVLIGQINKVLAEYSEHLPLTGRQIYYRLIDTYSRPKGKQFEDRLYEVLQRENAKRNAWWTKSSRSLATVAATT